MGFVDAVAGAIATVVMAPIVVTVKVIKAVVETIDKELGP